MSDRGQEILRRRRERLQADARNWKQKHRYIDYLVELAAKNPCEGKIEEPRAYFDILPALPASQRPIFNNAAPFQNGEDWPVMITHMTAALYPAFGASPETGFNEEDIQRVAMRMQWDDTYYQSTEFIALPNWANRVSASSASVDRASSSYTFDRPLILGARDSLEVDVQLATPPSGTRLVNVCFHGVGLLSGRPYILSGESDIGNAITTRLDPEQFINGGEEPIALTDCTMMVSAESTDLSGRGDIRYAALGVRVIGNGTQAQFFQGPDNVAIARLLPGSLLGVTTGRAIVHEFPGNGMRMEPGNSFRVEAIALDTTAVGLRMGIAFHGYLAVR